MIFLTVISVFAICIYPIFLDLRTEKEIEAYEKNKDRTSSDGLSGLTDIFLDPEEFLK